MTRALILLAAVTATLLGTVALRSMVRPCGRTVGGDELVCGARQFTVIHADGTRSCECKAVD